MQNNLGRKILSALLFILIFVFTYLVFKNAKIVEPSFKDMMYFGGILLSALVLFVLVFSQPIIIKNVYEEAKTKTQGKEAIETELKKEKEREEMEEHSLAILRDIQKHNDIKSFAETLLIKFSKQFATVQGVAYYRDKDKNTFNCAATYALYEEAPGFVEGNGINGQVALNNKPKLISDIPENYITVISGLGSSSPSNLLILPFVYKNKTVALVELAAFDKFPEFIFDIYNEINNSIAKKFNSLIE